MINVADYVIVNDNERLLLSAGQERTFRIPIPETVVPGTNFARAIFMLEHSLLTNNGTFNVDINDTEIIQQRAGATVKRPEMEIFNATVLRPGQENTVQIRVINGRFQFSDAVLWFKRTVSTS